MINQTLLTVTYTFTTMQLQSQLINGSLCPIKLVPEILEKLNLRLELADSYHQVIKLHSLDAVMLKGWCGRSRFVSFLRLRGCGSTKSF